MAIAGALIGGAIGAYGKKPVIPDLPKIDAKKVQNATISDNLSAMPDLEQLGAQVNEYNQKQQMGMLSKALEFALPGGFAKAQSIIGSQLAGEIPDDVNAQIQRESAAQAMAGGYGGGSGLGRNLTLRDLGLTSLGVQQQGLANFQSFGSMFAPAQQFDVTSMFFSPQQRLEFAFRDRDARFQRNLLANQVAAAPDPARAALGKEIDRFFNTWASFGMMAAGSGMGGGGGSMMSGGGGGGGSMQGPTGGWGYGGFNQNWLNNQVSGGSANGAGLA